MLLLMDCRISCRLPKLVSKFVLKLLVLIALAELMTYVCVACVRGKFWRGQTKWYGSDNTNTVGWIRDRYATNPIAQFLLRVLGIAEAT